MKYGRPEPRKLTTNAERQELVSQAHNKNIIDVAMSLGMTLEKVGRDYQWKEHDSFKLISNKNYFYWNLKEVGGDPIKLVELMLECNFREAVSYLTETKFADFDKKAVVKKEFKYFMKEAQNPVILKNYLGDGERKISESTIDFFLSKGIIAQSNFKDLGSEVYEPVIVFKGLDKCGNVKGMALQGINENFKLYPERGRLKKTFGDGYYGCVVRIGNPPSINDATADKPLKIIAFEAPIDMMSYYDIFKSQIGDAVLVAMNGKKKTAISLVLANEFGSNSDIDKKIEFLNTVEKQTDGTDKVKIILAVDNDEAGKHFVEHFKVTKIPVVTHLPKKCEGQEKMDWNEKLKELKQPRQNKFEERLNAVTKAPPSYIGTHQIGRKI